MTDLKQLGRIAHYGAVVRPLQVLVTCALVLLMACSASDADETLPVPETPLEPAPAPGPTSSIAVSDEVPSLDELLDIGLTESQAKCFIAEIDPAGTGRVTDADLFMTAMGNCL